MKTTQIILLGFLSTLTILCACNKESEVVHAP